MHLHVRIHHWVLLWIYVGIACGAVALVNILGRTLSPDQETWILVIGVLFWVIGGVICYARDAVRIETPRHEAAKSSDAPVPPQVEWHSASDFVLPGNRKSILPPKY